ncbi:hypothetical protein FJ955_12200 [Mesorhizobium sp. B2-2-2]|nr:hypothetical protein FJ955_12200 [Mesorhizobium sp. B2-2-2]
MRSLERFTVRGNGEPLYLLVFAQFPRKSTARFSQENRTLFLKLLYGQLAAKRRQWPRMGKFREP